MFDLEAMLPKTALVISFAVRPEEIELAFATNGESLRERMLLALVAELATHPTAGAKKRRGAA